MHASNPNDLLIEFDRINQVIGASEAMLQTLVGHRDRLAEELDAVTRPPLVRPPAPRIRSIGFEYRGSIFTPAFSLIDLHVDVLRRLWQDFPGKRETMAAAIAARGRTRCYVATEREALFEGQSAWWALQHSQSLGDGWYADTTVTRERIRTLLPIAARVAGLEWNTDLRIYLRPSTIVPAPGQ